MGVFRRLKRNAKGQHMGLFHCDHLNVVLPPSVHVLDGFVYRWKAFGEILEVSWQWLQEVFGFTGPQQSKHKCSNP